MISRTRLLTYDLNREQSSKSDYEAIYEYLESVDAVRLSESSYAFDSDEAPSAIFNRLQPYVDENDLLLVLTLDDGWAGRHLKTVIEWLKERLES